jgi:hypothetical protein
VELCGSWSGWTAFDEMTKGGDGFTLDIDVPFGKHTYKFILDGNVNTIAHDKSPPGCMYMCIFTDTYLKPAIRNKFG